MFLLVLRILLFVILIAVLYQVFAYGLRPKNKELRCPRCLGKGSWDGIRAKESCDRCKGTGRLLKQ